MFEHLSARGHRLLVLLATVAIVAGSFFGSATAGAAAQTAAAPAEPTAHVRVARIVNFRVPDTDPTNCSTSDASVIHCWVEHLSSWRLQVLCIRVGSTVVTVTGKGPDFVQPITCTPLPPNTTDFKSGPPQVASKGPSCTTSDAILFCTVRQPQRNGTVSFLCRRPGVGAFEVRLKDTTFNLTHTCGYEESFQLAVGASRGTPLPRHVELRSNTDRCQSSNEKVAVCWTHGRSEGFAMHCFAPGDVILSLKHVLGGDLDLPLSCREL